MPRVLGLPEPLSLSSLYDVLILINPIQLSYILWEIYHLWEILIKLYQVHNSFILYNQQMEMFLIEEMVCFVFEFDYPIIFWYLWNILLSAYEKMS